MQDANSTLSELLTLTAVLYLQTELCKHVNKSINYDTIVKLILIIWGTSWCFQICRHYIKIKDTRKSKICLFGGNRTGTIFFCLLQGPTFCVQNKKTQPYMHRWPRMGKQTLRRRSGLLSQPSWNLSSSTTPAQCDNMHPRTAQKPLICWNPTRLCHQNELLIECEIREIKRSLWWTPHPDWKRGWQCSPCSNTHLYRKPPSSQHSSL